ncbi:hypothetical protein COCVIDRAFT_26142 [Bipolaris victoriae FI3]|uniref:Carrier domain-containing protein n=1 Tax=Bipolaris victoriae (strain FI3) TaxID=930091 RepID=W7ENK9_BIPV3|nr:hypothetical protein COCVIDRAFT_26142 [Bipolaris victoriae FI3]
MSSRICGIIELTGLHSPEGPDEKTAYSEDDRKVTERANVLANLHFVSLEKGYELDFFSIITSTPPTSQIIDMSYSLAENKFYWSRVQQGMPCTRIHIGTHFTAEQTLELLCTAFITPSPPGKYFQGPIYALSEGEESQESEESSCDGLGDARQYVFLNHHKATKRRLASAKENQTTVRARVEGQNVEEIVAARLSKLLWIPLEKVRTDVSLSSMGIDSMIASEFRMWLQQALNISVIMLELLSQ